MVLFFLLVFWDTLIMSLFSSSLNGLLSFCQQCSGPTSRKKTLEAERPNWRWWQCSELEMKLTRIRAEVREWSGWLRQTFQGRINKPWWIIEYRGRGRNIKPTFRAWEAVLSVMPLTRKSNAGRGTGPGSINLDDGSLTWPWKVQVMTCKGRSTWWSSELETQIESHRRTAQVQSAVKRTVENLGEKKRTLSPS